MTPRRDVTTQGPPAPAQDLTAFPDKKLEVGRRWFRQHCLPPWYFDSGPKGRFNLDAPRGTCYLASSEEAAAREHIGPEMLRAGVVPAQLLHGRFVSELLLPHSIRVAHLQDRRGLAFGVAGNELCHMSPYDVPRAWARAFDAAGFDGIWHTLRYSTTSPRGLSLFGSAGPAPYPEDPHPRSLRAVVESMHVTVLDTPPSSALTIVPPPPVT